MPGRRHNLQTHARAFDPVSVCGGLRVFAGRCGVDRCPRHASQRTGSGRVVEMTVGQQDGRHSPGRLKDRVQMLLVLRPGVDDEGAVRADHPRVGPFQREGARVGGQNSEHPRSC